MMNTVKRRMLIGVAGIAGIAIFTFVGGQVVKLLWNWLVPMLFGLPAVTYWQALGLLALCRILFGGFGRHGRRSWRMKDEDREVIRRRVRERWGVPPTDRSSDGVQL